MTEVGVSVTLHTGFCFLCLPLPGAYCTLLTESLPANNWRERIGLTRFRLHNWPG